jgi:transposase
MANEFWLSDRQWAALEPLIPMHRRGVKPKRNREIISGIMHISKVGCRWRDCPEVYGPHTTIYNRFNRWSRDGIWQKMLEALVDPGSSGSQSIDSTTSKAHRCAAGDFVAGTRRSCRRMGDVPLGEVRSSFGAASPCHLSTIVNTAITSRSLDIG